MFFSNLQPCLLFFSSSWIFLEATRFTISRFQTMCQHSCSTVCMELIKVRSSTFFYVSDHPWYSYKLQGGPNLFLSSKTVKLMVATKFSDYLGLNRYKKSRKLKHFIHLDLATQPQSSSTYHSISPSVNSGHQLKKYVPVM